MLKIFEVCISGGLIPCACVVCLRTSQPVTVKQMPGKTRAVFKGVPLNTALVLHGICLTVTRLGGKQAHHATHPDYQGMWPLNECHIVTAVDVFFS